MMFAEQLKSELQKALSARPLKTPLGEVVSDMVEAAMGAPSGSHRIPRAWVYRRLDAPLHMIFQFYKNFTDHDLICKVMPLGQYPASGNGASIQFNANKSVTSEPPDVALQHHGRVTISTGISRDTLIASMLEICPSAMKSAGVTSKWPLRIGSTQDIPCLLDNLFLYAYCVEQAKRHRRGEDPLPIIM